MSAKVQELVWKYSQRCGTERLVMLLLAKFSNKDGELWTTYQVISQMARINRRSAIKCVNRLLASGELELTKKGSGRIGNTYKINLGSSVLEDTSSGVLENTSNLSSSVPENTTTKLEIITSSVLQDTAEVSCKTLLGCPTGHPKGNKRDIKVVKSNDQIDADTHFEAFWNAVPKKAGKKKAQAAFKMASKMCAPKMIIEHMIRYADQVTELDPRYIMHPTTWLIGERWNDEHCEVQQGDGNHSKPAARASSNSFAAGIDRFMSREEAQ